MSFTGVLDGWVALIGGISGLVFMIYAGGMLYFSSKRRQDIEALRLDLAELKGMMLIQSMTEREHDGRKQ